jgi:hypothetical protein
VYGGVYGGIQGTAQGSKSVRGTFVIPAPVLQVRTTHTCSKHAYTNRMKKIVGLQLLNQFSVDYRLLSTSRGDQFSVEILR